MYNNKSRHQKMKSGLESDYSQITISVLQVLGPTGKSFMGMLGNYAKLEQRMKKLKSRKA